MSVRPQDTLPEYGDEFEPQGKAMYEAWRKKQPRTWRLRSWSRIKPMIRLMWIKAAEDKFI